jgi:lipopolysaccharide transport system ATP-binding protein
MSDVAHEGRTVLFVSHNMNAVLHMCSRGIVLDHGQVAFDGDARAAVTRYIKEAGERSAFVDLTDTRRHESGMTPMIRGLGLKKCATNQYVECVHTGDDVTFDVVYDCGTELVDVAQVAISTLEGQCLFTVGTHLSSAAPRTITGQGTLSCHVRELPLNPGEYDVSVMFTKRLPWQDVDYVEGALRFEVEPADFFGTGLRPGAEQGPIAYRSSWSLHAADQPARLAAAPH